MNSPNPDSITESPRDLAPRHAAALLALLVLVGAALRVYRYEGFENSDEMAYLQAASDLASGDYRFPHSGYGNHAWLRYTIVLPLALHIRIYGPDDRACAAPFLLVSLVAILVAYGIGRDLCRSRAAGLLAAMILALNNREVFSATRLYPDAVQSIFLALCMWGVIRSYPSQGGPVTDSSSRLAAPQKRGAFFIGMSFALAYNSNLISVIFLPSLGAVLLTTHPWRRVLRMAVWMLAGSAALYVPLMIFFWIAGGTPFLEFAAISHGIVTPGEETNFTTLLLTDFSRALQDFWSEVRTADFYAVQRILRTDGGFFSVARPAAVCLAAGLILRQKTDHERWAWRCAALWLLVLYLVYEFGTPFLPLRKMSRYFHMFLYPMTVVIVATLSPYLNRRAVAPGILLGLLFGAAYYALPSGRHPDALILASGFAGIFAILTILLARHDVAQMLGIGLLALSLLFWYRGVGAGLSPHTQLSRAARKLKPPDPVYTNSWRTEMLLQCLSLHARGPDGVVHSCEAAPLVDAIDRGHAVVLYTRPAAQYKYCDLPLVETQHLIDEFERRATKLFDNGLYKVYRTDPPNSPATSSGHD